MTDTELLPRLRTVLKIMHQIEGFLAVGGHPTWALSEAADLIREVESELDERVTAEVHEAAVLRRILEHPECWEPVQGFDGTFVGVDGDERRLVFRGDQTSVVAMDFPKEVERSLDLMGIGSREELELLIDRLEEHGG